MVICLNYSRHLNHPANFSQRSPPTRELFAECACPILFKEFVSTRVSLPEKPCEADLAPDDTGNRPGKP